MSAGSVARSLKRVTGLQALAAVVADLHDGGAFMLEYRVLHIHFRGLYGAGGIPVFIRSMMAALKGRFVSHAFSLASGRVYESADDISTESELVGPLAHPKRLRMLTQYIRAFEPDIVHMHWPSVAPFGAVASSLSRTRPKRITHLHGFGAVNARGLQGLVNSRAMRASDAILACSAQTRSECSDVFSLPEEKVQVLYNPVDVTRFASAPAAPAWRVGVAPDPKDTLAVFVGRLSVQTKGLDIICEAVNMLPDRLRLKVALVGTGDQAEVGRQVELSDRIILPGPVPHSRVPEVMKSGDFFVHPSRSETFGISIAEASAAGLAVVATNVGGIPEIVEHGVSGILLPPEDPEALAEAMLWMVEHPDERRAMGLRGQELAQRFDVRTIAEQLAGVYRRLLAS